MADKFGRNYQLVVQDQYGLTITIGLPLTVEFDIQRTNFSSTNEANIRVYNLSQEHRNRLRKDAYDLTSYRSVYLLAGYGISLKIIFKGNITQAYSVREGSDFITTIVGNDGGFAFANPVDNPVFQKGTPNQNIIEALALNWQTNAEGEPTISLGSIGTFSGASGLGASYAEDTQNILSLLTGGGFFIDNEIANCLNSNEYISGPIATINAKSGLLNTPVLENTTLYFNMIMQSDIHVGNLVNLKSITDFKFNGPAIVRSIKHRGTISTAVCGEAITTLGLDVGPTVFANTESFVPVQSAAI